MNLRAIWLMIVAMAAFAICDMFIKLAAETLGLGQIVLFLALGSLPLFVVMRLREGGGFLTSDVSDRAFLIRTLGEFIASTAVIVSLAVMPFVTFSSIIQAQPLAITLGAALFLGERVGWRRWLAVALGFVGVMIVLRPGLQGWDWGALWALLAVLGMSMRDLGTRALPGRISTAFAAAWALLAVALGGLVLMPLTGGWRPVSGTAALYAAGFIASGALAYLTITLAMRVGEVSSVAPFRFSRIVFAMLIGYIVFGERPDALVWTGTAVIIASGLYALLRERRVAREASVLNPAKA